MKSDLVDLELILVHRTPHAIKVKRDEDDKKPEWLPLSAIEWAPKPGSKRIIIVTMPQRLAEEKGLV